jgi:hypothetical protein
MVSGSLFERNKDKPFGAFHPRKIFFSAPDQAGLPAKQSNLLLVVKEKGPRLSQAAL